MPNRTNYIENAAVDWNDPSELMMRSEENNREQKGHTEGNESDNTNVVIGVLKLSLQKPSTAKTLLVKLENPLASNKELAGMRGISLRQVYTHLKELNIKGNM